MNLRYFIFIPLFLIGCSTPHHSNVVDPFPAGLPRSSLSIEAFKFIGSKTTMQQVIQKLGQPSYYGAASGFLPDHVCYILSDGSVVSVGYDDDRTVVYVTHDKDYLFGHPYFPQK
jgi:hypothetical protein